jgi:hypothetical protein
MERRMQKSIAALLLATLLLFGDSSTPNGVNAQPVAKPPNPAPWLSLLLLEDAFGLDRRPANATCLAPPRATAGTIVRLTTPYPALPGFTQPTALLQAPGEDSRWYVLEKAGRVRVFENEPTVASASLWLDIGDRVNTNS